MYDESNPGIFMRALVGTFYAVQFYLRRYRAPFGGGWKLASAADVEGSKEIFGNYNAGGVPLIAPFKSGNCRIAVKGGKLIISSSVYGYHFQRADRHRCNPAKGYGERVYGFYRLRTPLALPSSASVLRAPQPQPDDLYPPCSRFDSIVQWCDLADVSGTTTTTAPPAVDCAVEDWND